MRTIYTEKEAIQKNKFYAVNKGWHTVEEIAYTTAREIKEKYPQVYDGTDIKRIQAVKGSDLISCTAFDNFEFRSWIVRHEPTITDFNNSGFMTASTD